MFPQKIVENRRALASLHGDGGLWAHGDSTGRTEISRRSETF